VCGLGNRKDRAFNAWLAANRVRAYPGTLRLLGELRRAGVRTAVFSASRNAEAVLRNAGVLPLFDAKVDGLELARLRLPGKPDPAMLLEAARRLDAPPRQCVVLEDAIAGVQAGVHGGFGAVVGVARAGNDEALRDAGADPVVHDLAELRLAAPGTLEVKTFANLPEVLDLAGDQLLSGRKPAVFLDYDGTLTPIVEDHTQAVLHEDMRAALARLAARCPVTIVSGRDLERLRALVGLEGVWYAGSHGLEIAGPDGSGESLEKAAAFLEALDALERKLQERLAGIPGHAVERKRFSIAVHYRRVASAAAGEVKAILDEALSGQTRFRVGRGKKVYEIRPDIPWDKGRAVLWILQRLGLDKPEVLPVYVGDDLTDEDAFRALAGRGLCVAVRHDETRPTAADYAVADTQEVKRLLELLAR